MLREVAQEDMTSTRKVVLVLIRGALQQRAVSAMLHHEGWEVVSDIGVNTDLRLVDQADDATGAKSIYLCPPQAHPCALALDLLLAGRVGGVVTEDRIETLPEVLRAADMGSALLSFDIFSLASGAPRLSDRHRRILELLLCGLDNRLIAKELCVSSATVKRALSDLYDKFETRTVSQLTSRALALGYDIAPTC
jgi:DNA-binding NarL/FixJ family response regulator